ncbi:hypothetical protein GE09DRAFT_1179704 [Coniochaeta sp. 2T2.1]|nr:hypothetical protein GE09DRAFT_1179704 [Coniochaeta sp. 2T2.1]
MPKYPQWTEYLTTSKRWATPSGSRNADAEYRYAKVSKGEDKAYEYICICHLRWEEDEEEEEDDENPNKPKCDGGKTCVCQKPAAEHPEHKMLTTNAGFDKFLARRTMIYVRNADMFSLHFYNDYRGYGALEVFESLILDYAENEGDLKEQWAVIEGMAWFLLDESSFEMRTIDDGPRVDQTLQLAGRLFLSHLAKLQSQNLLTPTSEYKDLGFSSAVANHFGNYILAYARKHDILLVGPADIDEVHEKKYAAKGDGPLWRKGKKGTLGGDKYDVMAMTPAERKARHFDGKDPLGPKELEAIKIGLVPRRRSFWLCCFVGCLIYVSLC